MRLNCIGIDQDTAFVLKDGHLEVAGCGAIYIVDGRGLTHSRVRETKPNDALSSFDFRLHVLSAGDRFKLDTRTPIGRKDEPAETD